MSSNDLTVHDIDEKLVDDFLLELYRIYKASVLYPSDHPSLLRMFVKPFKDISTLLDQVEEIAIGYRRGEDFLLRDIPVARKYPVVKEFGEELFIRRVKTVFFLRGLKLIELRSFMEVITADPRLIQNSGGCESLLQSKRVRHIWFNEVDYKKVLDRQKEADETALEIDSRAVADNGKSGSDSGEGIYGFLDGGEEHPDMGAVPQDSGTSQAQPGVAERQDSLPDDIGELIKIWKEAKTYGDFERLGNSLLSRAFAAAVQDDSDTVLNVVKAFVDVAALMKGEKHGEFALQGLDRIAGGKEPLDVLLKRACMKNLEDVALIDIIVRLGGRAAGRVVERLAVENEPHGRHVLNSILVMMGREIVPQLLERLGDDRWYMVRNMVRVLGEIGVSQGVEDALKHTLTHPDHHVRKETVRAIAMIKSPDALNLLRSALNDSDNGVVELAAVSLGLLRDEGAVQTLMDLLKLKEENSVRREIVLALGRIGSRKAVYFLVKTLNSRHWMEWKKDDDLKVFCAEALGDIRTPEAVEALEAGLKSSREAVRKACEDGLRRVRLG